MRYLAIALLLGGCATSKDADLLRAELNVAKLRLDETRYHVQIESCRTTALVCGIVTKDEEECINVFSQCVTSAINGFRARHGKEPSDLFDKLEVSNLFEPKRAR